MIQEPLGGSGFLTGDRKVDNNEGILQYPTFPSPSPSSTPALSYSSTPSATSLTSSENNLKCPRCDSSNTKFCYYNNYNLTQLRHFCKTCRRYWTKGGALRNVPIGGGCRKNRSVTISTVVEKASAGKMKTLSPEIGGSFIGNGLDLEFLSSPVTWGSPQNFHIFALLRAAENPNPTCNSIVNSLKEKGAIVGLGSLTEPLTGTGALRSPAMGSDSHGQASPRNLGNDLWRNNKLLGHHQIPGLAVGEVQNNGIQELYQSLRSSSNNYSDRPAVVFRNSPTSFFFSASTVLDSNPVVGGGLGWNPAFSWPSDPPTTNGVYP